MIQVDNIAELESQVGQQLGTSEWLSIDQPMIDRFAEATGDRNWYHVNVERARQEMPDGKTIAHGMMLSSLIPGLAGPMLRIEHRKRALNYGSDKIRYLTPVQVGNRIRLHVSILRFERRPGGVLLARQCTMELEGHAKPAMIAEVLTFLYE